MKILKDKKAIAVFLLPAFIVYSVIVMVPILVSIYYSCLDWNGIGKKSFVGFNNYIKLFGDSVFRQAFGNNIIYIVIVMVLQLGFGFSIAVLLTYLKKGRGFIQTVYYIPSVITVIAISQLFTGFYSYEPLGLFNIFRKMLGMEPIAFLSEYKTVLWAVASVEGWQYIGIYMIIFYSALVSVSPDILEAARIDGANAFQIYLKVFMPILKPSLILVAVLNMITVWNDYLGPLIFLQERNKYTLALGLAAFKGVHSTKIIPMLCITIIMIIPPVLTFIFSGKHIVESTGGGVK